MAIQFLSKDVTHWSKATTAVIKKSGKKLTTKAKGAVPHSSSVSGVEIRLLPPYIKDNNTTRFGPFPGLAKLYCLVIVVSDGNNQLTGGIDLQGFPRIGDKEYLPINKSIFYWLKGAASKTPPTQIHMMCSVIKSKQALRDTGKILSSLKTDDDYKGITQQLAGLATNATVAGAVVNIVTQLASIVGKYLGGVDDKPVGTVINSYTVINGDFDKKGSRKFSYPTKKVDFEFDLIVRDQGRKEKLVRKSATRVNGEEEDKVVVKMMKV